MSYKIGIDVGGTFTDLVISDEQGSQYLFKSSSTPSDPSLGVFNCLQQAAESFALPLRELLAEVETIVHGTTITTNAALTHKGARTGFLTTRGFRDLLNMRRGMKNGERYDLQLAPPPVLIERALTLTVDERVDASGEILIGLNESHVREAAQHFRNHKVEAVAVSYLWSFLNPAHELRTREILQEELPEVYISLSCEVLPQIRVYERHSTTALNSFTGPPLAGYLQQLQEKLKAEGYSGLLTIMQSNGGCMSPDLSARFAVNTLLSGPAGGPVAGIHYGELHNFNNIITVDMGGTSFDVAIIREQTPVITSDNEVGGYHVAVPMLDIHTVGAGGGSIAWIDDGGMLHVGPQSTGAEPGPACYGRGGKLPTVTDADLILGYLDADFFHGGALTLNRDAAIEAIDTHIATPLNISVEEAAYGIYRVANSIMSAAVNVVTVQRGHDPRDFVMIVAGGAGPVHAVPIARELSISSLLVPRESSVFCAAGMLLSDLKRSYVRSCTSQQGKTRLEEIHRHLTDMKDSAIESFSGEGIEISTLEFQYSADLRYVGQFNEVEIKGFDNMEVNEDNWNRLVQTFHQRHDELYGYNTPAMEVELINLRLNAIGQTDKPQRQHQTPQAKDASHALKQSRRAYFDTAYIDIAVYDALKLQSGNVISGPAIIEQATNTIILPEGAQLNCDAWGNFLIQT